METHRHSDSFAERLFEFRSVPRKRLAASLVITAVVMCVELAGGILTDSMALVGDAGHMFTHAFAIALSLGAVLIARRPPCHHRTFGLYRAEILAAFANGIFLLLVGGVIIYEAALRILHPKPVLVPQMLAVAVAGLAVNGVSILLLFKGHEGDLNVKSVFYHVAADTLSSVAIIAGAVVIRFTGWNVIDPLLSLVISAAILVWSWSVLKESGQILLEMSPDGVSTEAVGRDLKEKFPQILEIRSVHFWTITPDMLVFSAHLRIKPVIASIGDSARLVARVNRYLRSEYRVIESTLQILPPDSA